MDNLTTVTSEWQRLITGMLKKKEQAADISKMYTVLEGAYTDFYNQIHGYLYPQKTTESEKEIIQICNFIINTVFPIIAGKLQQIEAIKLSCQREMKKKGADIALVEARYEAVDDVKKCYDKLEDDYYALAACRSIEHFALYMERAITDPNERIMTQNTLEGNLKSYWYYANRAILFFTWKNIFLEMPTGYGKDYTDTVTQAYMLGVNIEEDAMKIAGNPSVIADNSIRLIKYIQSPSFAKVFPYYARFDKPEHMFQVCQVGGQQSPTRILVQGSSKGCSLFFTSKERSIDGVRYKRQFFNDVTASNDANLPDKHANDNSKYYKQWERRKYNDTHVTRFFKGTAYSIYDFLNTQKRNYGFEDSVLDENFRVYETPMGKMGTRVNKAKRSVFIAVPKLDFAEDENGLCTLPQQYSTEETRQKMHDDPEEFWAMDMQSPLPPEGTPFDYRNLLTYSVIPHEDTEETECCWASLDPPRTGKNYLSMPILVQIDGKHYLKDCIYELKRIEDMYNEVVEKIIRHNITRLHIEKNTDTSLATVIAKMLAERGVTNCDITQIYTVKNKEQKIMNSEASIRNNVVFPRFGIFAEGSSMGKFMRAFTSYSYNTPNKFDDAPDAMAMYNEKFIQNKATKNKVTVLRRKRN